MQCKKAAPAQTLLVPATQQLLLDESTFDQLSLAATHGIQNPPSTHSMQGGMYNAMTCDTPQPTCATGMQPHPDTLTLHTHKYRAT